MILAFRRPASPFASADLVLYGLDADKTYVFTDADTGKIAEYSGKTLMSEGLPVHIENKRESRLIRFQIK